VNTYKEIGGCYQLPAPAKDLLAEFWKLEKEAEKMLEEIAQ
jgi:type I restriction enzyme M protein